MVEATAIDPATDPPRPVDRTVPSPASTSRSPSRSSWSIRRPTLEIRINDDKESEGDEHFLVRVAVSWDGEPIYFDVPVTITDDDPSIL